MIKACVIGWPISHSRSPIIHGYWLQKHGIEGAYTREPVEPERLAAFLGSLVQNGYAGCNVTLPHKETTFGLVKPADEATRLLGAVNTVYVRDGAILGTNTDGEGFINSLKAGAPELEIKGSRAIVLGAGGAALAIVNALLTNGAAEIVVINRSAGKSSALCERFGARVTSADWSLRSELLDDCDLLVNTTSLGMKGQPELDIDLHRLDSKAVVTDIVYTPLRTALLNDAARRGNRVVEGLGMLLHQAVRGFELWFGTRPSVTTELHDLVARDIDPEYGK
ncbi:shikimate dehydrogenase [Aestuariivirga sp.]|uniref:shikimate dehydrogenase n=1 Tax=Aestuariivirga sp. TaxID=2650926 RepID=UPI0035935F26